MSIRTKFLLAFSAASIGLLSLLSGILIVQTHTRFGIVCKMVKREDPLFSTDVIHHFNAALTKSLLVTLLVFIIVAIGVAAFLSRLLSARILSMQRHACELTNGNWKTTIPVTGNDELSQLEKTLNYLALELDHQEEVRKSLMQDIAHELRTPLTTMKSHMEAFLDGVWEPTEARLTSCIEELDRFQHLVNQVEELYAAESCVSRPSSLIDLGQTVCSVTELFTSRCDAEHKKLRVMTEPDPVFIHATPHDVAEILWNLIDNAVKYTPSPGVITIHAFEQNGFSYLTVTDTGMGIPADEINHIFDRFYRVEKSRNRSTGGSGLGLAIVKRLVNLSGGNIRVNSQKNQGSQFVVEWQSPVCKTGAEDMSNGNARHIRPEFA